MSMLTSKVSIVARGESRDTATIEGQPQKYDEFHCFPFLPNEIKNMIVKEAVDYDPVVTCAEAKICLVRGRREVKMTSGSHAKDSEFRRLINLAEALPDCKAYLENEFGCEVASISRSHLSAHRVKDLMLFSIKKNRIGIRYDWLKHARECGQLRHSNGIEEDSICNIGIRFNPNDTYSLGCVCFAGGGDSRPHANDIFCPVELATFVMNFSHVRNVFVVILIGPGDFQFQRTKADVSKWFRKRRRERRKWMAEFDDHRRNFVEVVRSQCSGLNSNITRAFDLSDQAKSQMRRLDPKIHHSVFPRDQIKFRVLVAPYFISS